MKKSQLLIGFCLSTAITVSSLAETLEVSNASDSGAGSLRQTISDASPGDTIAFSEAINGSTIELTTGQILIDKDLSIIGPGPDALEINALNLSRIFEIESGATVTIHGLKLSLGQVSDFDAEMRGGGVYNQGILTLTETVIQDCRAVAKRSFSNTTPFEARGGGIYSAAGGYLTLERCAIISNSARGSEGALQPTLVAGGEAFGGGVYAEGLTATNCTFSENIVSGGSIPTLNTYGGYGGAIYCEDASLTLCTIAANFAFGFNAASGAGVFAIDGGDPVTLNGCLIVDNQLGPEPGDLDGSFTTLGYNIVEGVNDATFTGSTELDFTNIDTTIPALDDNGGGTQTHALTGGYLAIDAIPAGTLAITEDQRGFPRPTDQPMTIGAWEPQPVSGLGWYLY